MLMFLLSKSEPLTRFSVKIRSMALSVNCGVNLVRLFVITV